MREKACSILNTSDPHSMHGQIRIRNIKLEGRKYFFAFLLRLCLLISLLLQAFKKRIRTNCTLYNVYLKVFDKVDINLIRGRFFLYLLVHKCTLKKSFSLETHFLKALCVINGLSSYSNNHVICCDKLIIRVIHLCKFSLESCS